MICYPKLECLDDFYKIYESMWFKKQTNYKQMKKIYLFFVLLFSFPAMAQFDYQKIWSTYYFPETTKAYGSVIDNDGNIIVVGSFYRGILNTNPTEFHPSSYYEPYITPNAHQTTISEDNSYNQNDGFITKFSPDGGVIWSTFFGGSRNDGVYNVAVDNLNNIYVTGLTRSATGIATAGAYITDYSSMVGINTSGDIDPLISGYGFLSKFDASGSLQWSTYIPEGGLNDAVYMSLLVSNSNTVYVAGTVVVGNNNIATVGAYQENFHTLPLTSYNNGFILKFDGQGNRQAGTYFGSQIYKPGIASDSEGSIIITGSQSYQSDEILATPGSYQPIRPSSNGPGFIAKFSPDLSSKTWCTYYGDTTTPITLDAVSTLGTDIYFAGRGATFTTAVQGCATPGAFSEVPSSGFMAKINGAGTTRLWGTYLPFLATYNWNRVYDLTVNNNKLYIVGKTSTTTGVITPGAYQENYVSVPGESFPTTDTFIMQFNLDGARNWGTYFGGLLDDFISSINVTENGTFYISGYTSSTSMIATPNSLQPNLIVTPTITYYERITNMFLAKFANPLDVTNFADNNLKIVPNPNKGQFVLSGNLKTSYDTLSFVVYDNLGRVIAEQNFPSLQTEIYKEFNFSGVLAKGIYFAKLTSGNEPLQTFKILVE